MSRSLAARISRAKRHYLLKLVVRWPDLFYQWLYRDQMRRLDDMLRTGTHMFKTPDSSLAAYEAYDDREQVDFETACRQCLVDGEIRWATEREIRGRYLDALCAEIDAAIANGAVPTVLEVGCGNCINLVGLKERYSGRLELSGFDISRRRIEVARSFFGDRLNGVSLHVGSAANPEIVRQLGRQYGIVFSMHCLEQLPYEAHAAVGLMARLASDRVIMIEPVWEFARPAQRLYLMIADHLRTLLPAIKSHRLPVLRAEPLPVQSSLKNQSSIVVVDVTAWRPVSGQV